MGEIVVHTCTVPNSVKQVYAVAHTSIANSQVVSDYMAKGNAATLGRMKSMLRKMRDNSNSKFCTPLSTQADSDKSRVLAKASI